jgi:hypothetical protein
VCHSRAPAISESISELAGLGVRRIGTRPRNPANTAHPTERQVLEEFQRALDRGESITGLQWSQAGNGEFVYMQAIGVEPLCLHCHGKEIEPGLDAQIRAFYPDDLARNYSAGDLRGAFVVRGPATAP